MLLEQAGISVRGSDGDAMIHRLYDFVTNVLRAGVR